ncbi:MAG: hypothetical protein A2X12_08080 [Bacteroidetes bacterium GWE2_29_8]|nr:MAG: hypothetical protein A2X12_08080 [Bacteroidetes bacterium GWE2_29_8]
MQEQSTPNNTGSLQAIERADGGQFKKGCSGNPKGRPYGVRNKVSFAMRSMFEQEAFAVAGKLVELAKNGDMSAIKLILERVYPAPKNKELHFLLPEITDREGIEEARNEIQQAFVSGELAVSEAKEAVEFLTVAKNARRNELDFFC